MKIHWTSPVFVTVVNIIWYMIIISVFGGLGFLNEYARFGPNSELKFLFTSIDTWTKWGFLFVFTVINKFIQIYVSDILYPWIVNNVQNKKISIYSYNKFTVIMLVDIYFITVTIGSFIGVYLVLTQLDFLLAVLFSQVAATTLTTWLYLRKKTRYNEFLEIQ